MKEKYSHQKCREREKEKKKKKKERWKCSEIYN
jgi:hypothetical protein